MERPYTLALIAHDGKKDDLIRFAKEHATLLPRLHLVATATTGSLLAAQLGLEVERVASGPQGGDLEIGAMIVRGDVQAVVFFRDPLTAHPHEPDIQAVMKACDVHDVPLATNRATAEIVLERIAAIVEG
jgi:methylglyoxal synthase